MYRRIEVLLPIFGDIPTDGVPMEWVGVASLKVGRVILEEIGLPEPDLDKFDIDSFFWFSEEGWKRFGMKTLSLLTLVKEKRYSWLEIRVVEAQSLDIVWADKYQAAARDEERLSTLCSIIERKEDLLNILLKELKV